MNNKRIGMYAIWWALLLALFNVIAFVFPDITGDGKEVSFWIGYALISVMFVGQLLCAIYALKEENAQKLFYRLPLIQTTYSGLIATFFIGGLFMLLPLPYWIGVILSAIVLVINAVSILKNVAAVSEVERIDRKVKQQTFFIKSLTADADTLLARAKSDAVKAECKKVLDAVRYSDPMSNPMLAGVESQISIKFADLSNAVLTDDIAAVSAVAAEMLVLVKDRNSKCKLLK